MRQTESANTNAGRDGWKYMGEWTEERSSNRQLKSMLKCLSRKAEKREELLTKPNK